MNQCAKLEALIDQGHIRRIIGKLRWADGSNIIKEPEESWVNAVVRRLQQQDKVSTDEREQNKGVYLIEIMRDDSDADSDEQKEMGWRSGTSIKGNLQAYGAERTPRVSKEARQGTQRQHLLPKAHRVKELPPRGHLHDTGRKELGVISKNADLHRSQNRFENVPAAAIPIDVSPAKFKGELDSELVPMEVEEVVSSKTRENRRKLLPRDADGAIGDVHQIRARKGKAQMSVVNGLLSLPLTLSLQEIASISPSVRRDLAMTLKAIRDDQPEDAETSRPVEPKELKALGAGKEWDDQGGAKLGEVPTEVFLGSLERAKGREARGDLLKIEIKIGNATMLGVVDSGSMINMISAKKLEESGLPSVALNDKSFKITGVNGGTSRCTSWIPGATIYVSKEERETYGDIYVLENADFEFIAGRPWSTLNGGGIMEKPRGTYVSWITGDERYEINVSKATRKVGQVKQTRTSHADAEDETEEEEEPITALAVRISNQEETNQSCVPDSEESRVELDYGDQEGVDKPEEGNKLDQEEGGAGSTTGEEMDSDEDQGGYQPDSSSSVKGKRKRQEKGHSSNSPNRPNKRARVTRSRKQRIIVDQDLEEGFSRLVQTGANAEEWEVFCGKEKRRLARGDQRWFDWMDKENDDYASLKNSEPGETDDHQTTRDIKEPSAEPRNSPPEGSHTLGTPPQFTPKPVKTLKEEERSVSTEVVGRRSSRMRQETTCSTCGGAPMNQQKTYHRSDRANRTITKRFTTLASSNAKKEEEGETKVVSYGLRIVLDSEDEDRELNVKTSAREIRLNGDLVGSISQNTRRERKVTQKGVPKSLPTSEEARGVRVLRPLPHRTRGRSLQKVRGSNQGVQPNAARQASEMRKDELEAAVSPVYGRQHSGETDDVGSNGEDLPIIDQKRDRNITHEDDQEKPYSPRGTPEPGPWQASDTRPFRKSEKGLLYLNAPYFTWDADGNYIFHVPNEPLEGGRSRHQNQTLIPRDNDIQQRRTSASRGTTEPTPSERKSYTPSRLDNEPSDVIGPMVPPLKSLRHKPRYHDLHQNIRHDREAEPMTDQNSGSASNEDRTDEEAEAQSQNCRFRAPTRREGRTKGEQENKENINKAEVRSYVSRGYSEDLQTTTKEKAEVRRISNSQNWRQKSPLPPTPTTLTSKNQLLLLLLLSLLLIPLLLVDLSPPIKNPLEMNKKAKVNAHHSSTESRLDECPSVSSDVLSA